MVRIIGEAASYLKNSRLRSRTRQKPIRRRPLRRVLWRDKRKSAAYAQYVSILRRLLTQLLSVRCIFEMACTHQLIVSPYHSLLVARNDEAAGILRLSDIFAKICDISKGN